MDWNLIRSAIAAAAEGFFLPYGLLALVGFAIVGLIVVALLPDPHRRGSGSRCADGLEVVRRRAEERRRDWERRDADRLADRRALRRWTQP